MILKHDVLEGRRAERKQSFPGSAAQLSHCNCLRVACTALLKTVVSHACCCAWGTLRERAWRRRWRYSSQSSPAPSPRSMARRTRTDGPSSCCMPSTCSGSVVNQHRIRMFRANCTAASPENPAFDAHHVSMSVVVKRCAPTPKSVGSRTAVPPTVARTVMSETRQHERSHPAHVGRSIVGICPGGGGGDRRGLRCSVVLAGLRCSIVVAGIRRRMAGLVGRQHGELVGRRSLRQHRHAAVGDVCRGGQYPLFRREMRRAG